MNMPTTDWTTPAAAERTVRTNAVRPPPSSLALWRAVQLGVAIALTLALIRIGSIFAALPDMTSTDRWPIVLEILASRFANVGLQLAVLRLVILPQAAPRALHVLRFFGMVLLGTAGAAAPLLLLADVPSIRLGIVESTTTAIWSGLFDSLLIATFLAYQHGGQARSEEASRRLQQLQCEQQAARRRLVEAQLQALQARVDPQMFFDILDSVQRLYAADAARAEALLDELIVFLRAALPRLRSASSTLAQELELAASYFRLQTLRGGAPDAVRIALPDELAARAFPAGVILPLVAEARTAAIDVDVQPDAGMDTIVVSLHTGRAPAPRVLAQVRETLEALYGSAATLECRDTTADAHIETRITIAYAAT